MPNQDLPTEYFQRDDESEDENFYREPRKVVHIDDGAIAAAGQLYGELLPPGGTILDLMSAWRTHLPSSYRPGKVLGLGMNAEEMRDNPQLNEFAVQNLNKMPRLSYADQTFDGAICTVSVQYLTDPTSVFREVYRVLKAGAPFVLTYSNRCFPTKAVSVWQSATMEQKAKLVATYLREAGFADIHAEDRSPQSKLRLFSVGDPLFGVWGYRPSAEG